MKHDLNDAHMEKFQKAVKSLLDSFGLKEWLIDFEWIEDPENEALAQVHVLTTNRIALFQLNKTWTDEPTSGRIDRVAYHETLELLLNPICTIAGMSEEDVTRAGKTFLLEMERHAIIRRLENLYMGDWNC